MKIRCLTSRSHWLKTQAYSGQIRPVQRWTESGPGLRLWGSPRPRVPGSLWTSVVPEGHPPYPELTLPIPSPTSVLNIHLLFKFTTARVSTSEGSKKNKQIDSVNSSNCRTNKHLVSPFSSGAGVINFPVTLFIFKSRGDARI